MTYDESLEDERTKDVISMIPYAAPIEEKLAADVLSNIFVYMSTTSSAANDATSTTSSSTSVLDDDGDDTHKAR